jgi:hypothetical protein
MQPIRRMQIVRSTSKELEDDWLLLVPETENADEETARTRLDIVCIGGGDPHDRGRD